MVHNLLQTDGFLFYYISVGAFHQSLAYDTMTIVVSSRFDFECLVLWDLSEEYCDALSGMWLFGMAKKLIVLSLMTPLKVLWHSGFFLFGRGFFTGGFCLI